MIAPDLREVGGADPDTIWRQGSLTIKAAAEFLSVSRRTIYHLVDDGLPATKVRGRRLISRRALIDLLEAGTG